MILNLNITYHRRKTEIYISPNYASKKNNSLSICLKNSLTQFKESITAVQQK